GEPIEPDVWRWYFHSVGKDEAAITDTWWLTETGGFLGSTLPALEAMKPGSCGPMVLGIHGVIYDENGDEVPKGSGKAGNICIRNPWPGRMLTIWGQDERYVETYLSLKPGFEAGDGATKKVSGQIEKDIGKIARPKNVWVVPDMPKTRSGKIMRRVIAGISNFTDVGDVTTLANPEIVDQIREQVQSEKVA